MFDIFYAVQIFLHCIYKESYIPNIKRYRFICLPIHFLLIMNVRVQLNITILLLSYKYIISLCTAD